MSFQIDDKESPSSEELTIDFGQLKVAYESHLLSPDSGSTVSSLGNGNVVAASCSRSHEALNVFLKAVPAWLDWDKASERTRQLFVQRTSEIVSAVVKAISPLNALHLRNALQSSAIVSQQLGIPHEHLPTEKGCLETLAEAYKNSTSWDT